VGAWVCECASAGVCGYARGRARIPSPAQPPAHTPRHPHTPTTPLRASALILALWTLFFLATLALAVGAYVGANVELARRFSADTAAYALARAAIEKGIMLAAADTNAWDAAGEPWHSEAEFRDVSLGAGTYSVLTVSPLPDGGTATNYGLFDQERLVNINTADAGLLAALFEVGAGAERSRAEDLAAAVIDWRDADDGMLTGGAEDEYYRRLSPPYHCHDGPFGSMHEVRLVKGVDEELFRGIRGLATVHGTGKVNVNTAPLPVLLVLAAAQGGSRPVASSLAAKIVRFREAGNAFQVPSLTEMAGQLNAFSTLSGEEADLLARMARRYMGLDATCFSGTARGAAAGGERLIDFVFDRRDRALLYWYER